jgi:hypothetical protein
LPDLDALVRDAAPSTADLDHPAVRAAVAAFPAALCAQSRSLATQARARRRRRLRRRTVGLTLAGITLVAAPVGAAAVIAVHTGLWGHGGEEGTGELIRLDSPQFPSVLAQIRRQEHLPLPPGSNWGGLRARFDGVDGPSLQTTSGIAYVVEEYAHCAWQGAFIAAVGEGDHRLQVRAAAVLGQVPQWPQMSRQTDPVFRQVLRAEAAAAARGVTGRYDPTAPFDPSNIAQDYQVNCTAMQVGR